MQRLTIALIVLLAGSATAETCPADGCPARRAAATMDPSSDTFGDEQDGAVSLLQLSARLAGRLHDGDDVAAARKNVRQRAAPVRLDRSRAAMIRHMTMKRQAPMKTPSTTSASDMGPSSSSGSYWDMGPSSSDKSMCYCDSVCHLPQYNDCCDGCWPGSAQVGSSDMGPSSSGSYWDMGPSSSDKPMCYCDSVCHLPDYNDCCDECWPSSAEAITGVPSSPGGYWDMGPSSSDNSKCYCDSVCHLPNYNDCCDGCWPGSS